MSYTPTAALQDISLHNASRSLCSTLTVGFIAISLAFQNLVRAEHTTPYPSPEKPLYPELRNTSDPCLHVTLSPELIERRSHPTPERTLRKLLQTPTASPTLSPISMPPTPSPSTMPSVEPTISLTEIHIIASTSETASPTSVETITTEKEGGDKTKKGLVLTLFLAADVVLCLTIGGIIYKVTKRKRAKKKKKQRKKNTQVKRFDGGKVKIYMETTMLQ